MQEQARNTRVLVAAITNPNTTVTMKLCFVMPFYDYSSAQIRTYGLAFHNFYDTRVGNTIIIVSNIINRFFLQFQALQLIKPLLALSIWEFNQILGV